MTVAELVAKHGVHWTVIDMWKRQALDSQAGLFFGEFMGPFYGSRQMARHLRNQGYCVGRKRVRRLMARMGLRAVYQQPRTTVLHPEHRKCPYLLRDLVIDRPNHVWCADITYIPVRRGFLYLVAIMDWTTRRVLSWRLSNTIDVEFGTRRTDTGRGPSRGRPESGGMINRQA